MKIVILLLFIQTAYVYAQTSEESFKKSFLQLCNDLLIENSEDVQMANIITVKVETNRKDKLFKFFKLRTDLTSFDTFRDLSPLLKLANTKNVDFSRITEHERVKPNWPDDVMEKQQGLTLRWDYQSSKNDFTQSRMITLSCIYNEKQEAIYGILEYVNPPTNGNVPSIRISQKRILNVTK